MRQQIRRTRKPAWRLAGSHAHSVNLALGGSRDGIKPQERAGRHDDLAAPFLG
jgi:hypothetical protein